MNISYTMYAANIYNVFYNISENNWNNLKNEVKNSVILNHKLRSLHTFFKVKP